MPAKTDEVMRPKTASARSAYSMQLKDTRADRGSQAARRDCFHHQYASHDHQGEVNVFKEGFAVQALADEASDKHSGHDGGKREEVFVGDGGRPHARAPEPDE